MRIAVLNRGEAAVRFLRALEEYNIERGTTHQSVALYTDTDADAPFVHMADLAVALGPAMRTNLAGATVNAYCDHDHVMALLTQHRCEAVWPGWGFVSEDPAFVARLERAGILFIGPSSDAMQRLGDKIESKRLAEQFDVPVSPWLVIEGQGDDELRREAARIGYPLMVKASAGGGGRGIRKVDHPDQLIGAIEAARNEVARVFSAGGLFMEACITGGRHIEVQLAVDHAGKAYAVGVRDCSIQRRNQKVIEEAPSPVLTPEAEVFVCESACRLAEGAGYRNVGTAEFLYRPADGRFFFLEVNSRLQVEHTITELTTGNDLVKAQLDIAQGIAWRPNGPSRGHAIEVRLNAEDPERGFQPAPGLLRVFEPPAGPGIRIDSGVREGVTIAPEFDSMIAKVMAYGSTRQEAIARLIRALRSFPVVVEDGATNKAFLLRLLASQPYLDATASTRWIDEAMAAGELRGGKRQLDAALTAAILVHRRGLLAEVQRFFAEVQEGIPQRLRQPGPSTVKLAITGKPVEIDVQEVGPARYDARIGQQLYRVHFDQQDLHRAFLQCDGRRSEVLFGVGRSGVYVEVEGEGYVIEERAGGVVRAPAPAMIVSVAAQEGDVVKPGDRLATLEAMKMEIPLYAQEAGRITSVRVQPNQQVAAGQIIMALQPEGEESVADSGAPSLLGEPAQPGALERLKAGGKWDIARLDALDEQAASEVVDALIQKLEAILLGYDVSEEQTLSLIKLFEDDAQLMALKNPQRLARLADALTAFTHTESLFERALTPQSGTATLINAEATFYEFCRAHHGGEEAAKADLSKRLKLALRHHDIGRLEPSAELRAALWRFAVAHAHTGPRHRAVSAMLRALIQIKAAGARFEDAQLIETLDHVTQCADRRFPFVADNARQASYELFLRERFVRHQRQVEGELYEAFVELGRGDLGERQRSELVRRVATMRHSMLPLLVPRCRTTNAESGVALELTIRRIYERFNGELPKLRKLAHGAELRIKTPGLGAITEVLAVTASAQALPAALDSLLSQLPTTGRAALELVSDEAPDEATLTALSAALRAASGAVALERATLTWDDAAQHHPRHISWTRAGEGAQLERATLLRDIHPEAARRLDLWRLAEFDLKRLPSDERIFAFYGRAHSNPADEVIFVLAEVQSAPNQITEVAEEAEHLLEFEHAYFEAMRVLRAEQSLRPSGRRLEFNRVSFYVRPTLTLSRKDLFEISRPLEASTRGLGIQKIVIKGRVSIEGSPAREQEIIIANPSRNQLQIDFRAPVSHPIRALSPYQQSVIRARRLGLVYPYEVIKMLRGESSHVSLPHPDMSNGSFIEYDLDPQGQTRLIPVDRAPGGNTATLVVGLVSHQTARHADGMTRVFIASDPTMAMGALAEPECRRIIAALNLADELGIPVEWLPVSSGARIAMDSGTENLDWTAAVLRRIIEFTQDGGEINVIVHGVNVGAQSYWNAEATMLQHTRGALIMTPQASMVLTGKKALEYSGSVAAEDERGIGGVDRIMGPNGQAQYIADSLGDAYRILFEHYRYTYRRRTDSRVAAFDRVDSPDRSILDAPYHGEEGFKTIGEIFSDVTNPGRKRPFAIREVMRAVIDADSGALERYQAMAEADTAVIWDAHIGGHAACVIGFESRPLQRHGRVPMDGPDTWTGGTLFPHSSKKVARALNAASGNRPAVVIANLSGFDGSPESMRRLQLEYGAEIGRAVVNFAGPIVFVVVGRYHGGAYVVFSKTLNPRLTSLALEGAYASVIGGAPAAAVVFPRDVQARALADARVKEAAAALAAAPAAQRPKLREQLDAITERVTLEKQGEVAAEFDKVHSVQRAVEVGSLDGVITAARLRPAIIEVLDREQGAD